MVAVYELNNRASKLIAAGKRDEAERVLAQVRDVLSARPPVEAIDPDDLDPAMDEYFYSCHMATLQWTRKRFREGLPNATRAWELEKAFVEAGRARGLGFGDLQRLAFSAGAWAYISVLTGCERFEEAHRAFAEAVADHDHFWARANNSREAAEKIIIAGLCVYAAAPSLRREGRSVVDELQRFYDPDSPDVGWGYACFWALERDNRRAFEGLALALRRGLDPRRALDDPDLQSLHADRRWDSEVLSRIFTWKVDSTPRGALVYLDGKDTGRRTPARLEPGPRGRHAIRLVLDGHQDAEHEFEQSEGAGLSLCLELESLADIEARRRLLEELRHPPDEAARARTREFLGGPSEIARASLSTHRATTYGLGGVDIVVRGDGVVRIVKKPFAEGEEALKHELRLDGATVLRSPRCRSPGTPASRTSSTS